MKKINIAFDLDSVLVDPMPCFKKVIKKRYGAKIISHDTWHIVIEPEISLDEFIASWQEAYELWPEVKILPGARSLLRRLCTMAPDDPVKIITARRYEAANATYSLIKDRLMPKDGLFDLTVAPRCDKSKYLYHHRYFVEDRVKNVISLVKSDIHVFMTDWPWNQHCEPHPNVRRIVGVNELLPGCENFIIEV